MEMKKILSTMLFCLVCNSALAQNNVPIPMMYQGLQLPNLLEMRLQAERIRAQQLQNQQMEEQLRQQAERERQQRANTAPKQDSERSSKETDPIISAWLRAAAPRMGLFEDFEKVVFAPDVAINFDMIRLMTHSKYAADIAYYLATHRIESFAISQMPLAEAARAMQSIENRVIASATK